jgi:S23 ribosomal protein.
MEGSKREYLGFRDLECWKAAREVRQFASKMIKRFPSDEKYVLTSQLRRSARSACSNIAEGYGRFHFKENIQFCRIGRGSLFETSDHFEVALEEEYISRNEFLEAEALIAKASSLMNGYINYLKRQKTDA